MGFILTNPAEKRWHSLDLPWGLPRDAPPPPPESVRTAFARSYAEVITKFSRLDGLPFFITHGALLARAQAPLTKDNTDMSRTVKPSLYVLNAFGKKRKKRKMIFYEDVSYITGDPDVEYD